MTIKHIGGSERFSAIVIHGNVAYLAGQVSQKKEAALQNKHRMCLTKLMPCLNRLGAVALLC